MLRNIFGHRTTYSTDENIIMLEYESVKYKYLFKFIIININI